MAKPFSLQPLLNLAQQKNEAAINNLGKLNQQQHAAQTKLVTLQQFRRDYQMQFQQLIEKGITPVDMRNFQDFIYRLDLAIEQQQRSTEYANRLQANGLDELKETKRKMQSFDLLAQRHQLAERQREAKAEQKVQDEHAGRFAAAQLAERREQEQLDTLRNDHEQFTH
jgi:flagellar FliJ protein